MLRIGLLQLGFETNTFIKGRTQLKDMGDGDWLAGERVVSVFAGKHAALSGAIDAIRQAGAEPVGLDLMSRSGSFNAGPKLSRACVEEAMDHICAQLETRKDSLDGIFFAMHGAGCAEGHTDADSYFLSRLRQTVGSIPIMCSLDLHGNITEEMLRLSDGLFGIKELPHTDYYQAGFLAAKTLIEKLRGQCEVKMALRRLPMLLPSSAGSTIGGTAGEVKDYFADYVKNHGLLDATFFHGFSAMDSEDTCSSVLVVADGFEPETEADFLAEYVWSRRAEFAVPVYSAFDAVEAALSMVKRGYVVINEGSDNPGGGCPGDGTHLLREFIRRDLPGSIMGPLYDPAAAGECHKHSIGDRFCIGVGGHSDPVYGAPLELEVELLGLCDGTFECATPVHKGAVMCYGPTARVRCGQVELIVVSRRFQTYDDRPFLMTGARMEDYRIVGLKSMNHFRAFFTPIADGIVTADTPSRYPADLKALKYQHIRRPIYPLDEDTKYMEEKK